jgi:hypothetical protein
MLNIALRINKVIRCGLLFQVYMELYLVWAIRVFWNNFDREV